MRYGDWDVLLFPTGPDGKIPFKEFKTACHVVPDTEYPHTHGSSLGLPIMTTFVPSLQSGQPFQISVHSWRTPEVSQSTKAYSKHLELVKFEARIVVDGRLVACVSFKRKCAWPQVVKHTFEFDKAGELEPLRFPAFRRELLYQSYWSPGDEVGRIKIIISEGFPRDSLTVPIERVKNVVAFSFQHAPLSILESNGIAWPNASMWLRSSLGANLPVPSYHPASGSDCHSHSPRRRSTFLGHSGELQRTFGSALPGNATNHASPFVGVAPVPQQQRLGSDAWMEPRMTAMDPFMECFPQVDSMTGSFSLLGEAVYPSIWQNDSRNPSKVSQTDASLFGSISASSAASNISDQLQYPTGTVVDDWGLGSLRVPTNTPNTRLDGEPSLSASSSLAHPTFTSTIPPELATTLTHALLTQPCPLPAQPKKSQHGRLPSAEIILQKENRRSVGEAALELAPVATHPAAESCGTSRFLQSTFDAHALPPPLGAPGRGGSTRISGVAFSTTVAEPHPPSHVHLSPMESRVAFSSAGSQCTSGTVEFSVDLTNIPLLSTVDDGSLAGLAESSSDTAVIGVAQGFRQQVQQQQGTKRGRNFTPASAKVIDEEDEPRRVSPRLRTGSPGDK